MPDSSISTTYILEPNLRDAFWIGLFSFGASISISSTCVQRALNAYVPAVSCNFSNSISFPSSQNRWLMSSRERVV